MNTRLRSIRDRKCLEGTSPAALDRLASRSYAAAMSPEPRTPRGIVVTRTLAMPADTNPNGDIFGGWIMSQMDIAGGILAKFTTKKRVVTVAVDAMHFICPVKVGDAVTCYGEVVRSGTTSLTLRIEVWASHPAAASLEERECVTEAEFVYVAVDEAGHPVRVKDGP